MGSDIRSNDEISKEAFLQRFNGKSLHVGLRASDFHFYKYGNQIRAQVTTAVPSMVELFEKVFRKCGHTVKYPYLNGGRTQWMLKAILHKSYEFAVEKPTRIPQWIKCDRTLFMRFLAGYTDGDGSLGLYRVDRHYIIRKVAIETQDVDILRDIKEKLTEYGYHPALYLTSKKGTLNNYGPYNKDLWHIHIDRKDEDLKLLQELPLRHQDKIRIKSLILDTKDAILWPEVEGKIVALRKKFSDEIERYKLVEIEFKSAKKSALKEGISRGF